LNESLLKYLQHVVLIHHLMLLGPVLPQVPQPELQLLQLVEQTQFLLEQMSELQ
jgi:hypothetical protein